MRDDRGILEALLGDGRLLLTLTGFVLVLSGGFAIFQSCTGYFLPQDVHSLGYDAQTLARAAIMVVGMTTVFVPQDLTFMQVTPSDLNAVTPRLVPVIAHDRAGFGGGLFSIGIILLFIARHAPLTKSLVQIVALIGLAGF